jgi:hypothetical protein
LNLFSEKFWVIFSDSHCWVLKCIWNRAFLNNFWLIKSDFTLSKGYMPRRVKAQEAEISYFFIRISHPTLDQLILLLCTIRPSCFRLGSMQDWIELFLEFDLILIWIKWSKMEFFIVKLFCQKWFWMHL